MAERLQGGGNGDGEGVAFQPEDPKEKPEAFGKSVDPQQLQRELSIWMNKCLAADKRGEAASSIGFIPVHIPAENFDRITTWLERAKDAEAIKEVFAGAFRNDETPTLDAKTGMQADIDQWRENVLEAVSDGVLGDSASFDSENIHPTLAAAIEGALEEVTTQEGVSQVFADIWLGYP